MDKQLKTKFQQAVFLSDLQTIRKIAESDEFDRRMLYDLEVYQGVQIPVTYLTAAQLEIFREAENWDKGRGWIIGSRNKAVEVWHYWKDILNLETEIDYHRFARMDIMFCEEEDVPDEEILDTTYDELTKNGVRRIDAELYVATWRVDIARVNRLYNAGANPYTRILEEDCYAMDHVAAEASYLDTCIYYFYEDSIKGNASCDIHERAYLDLLGFGAFERMYNILHGKGLLDYASI